MSLIVRKENVICTTCYCIEPIHTGDGTPIEAYLIALQDCKERHSKPKHKNPYTGKLCPPAPMLGSEG